VLVTSAGVACLFQLAARIGVAREQDFFRLRAGHEDEDRFFLLDAAR
jgi:hypothetical protein